MNNNEELLRMQKLWQIELKNKTSGASIVHRHEFGFTQNPVTIPLEKSADELSFYIMNDTEECSDSPTVVKTADEIKHIMSEDGAASCDGTEYDALIRQALTTGSDDVVFPALVYEDITEQELFGFEPIPAHDIAEIRKGLWAWHGKRKFRFTVANGNDAQDESAKICIKLYFDTCDNASIEKIIFPVVQKDGVYYALIDTNLLGACIIDNTHTVCFYGSLEFTYTYPSDKNYSKVIRFPLCIAKHPLCSSRKKKLCAFAEPTSVN